MPPVVNTLVQFVERAAGNHASQIIHPQYAKLKQVGDHPTFGLCYPMAEAVYHLIQKHAPNVEVKAIQQKINFRGEMVSHWALKLGCGTVVDPSRPQFPHDMALPYHSFKGRAFYPQQSKACQFILSKVAEWEFLIPKS